MIKEYIEAKYGFKVHTAYIAEVKRDLGLPMYDAPNAVEELKQPRNGEALLSPSFLLSVYSFGIYIIARNFRSYSRGRVWAEPTKGNNHDALLVMQKNRK